MTVRFGPDRPTRGEATAALSGLGQPECCPDCGQPVCRSGIAGVDQAWKQHFDSCEPHQERVAFEEFNLSQDGSA